MKSSRLLKRIFVISPIFAVIALLTLAVQSVPAQTQESQKATSQESQKATDDVQQLKDKLKQLEQTVQELKTRLTEIEQPRLAPAAAATPAIIRPTPTSVPTPSEPPLLTTIPAATSKTAGSGEKKAAPQGESTFQIYGFAMLDMGYQFNQNHPDWFDVVRPTKLPSFRDEFAPDGHTYFSVRQSRLGVKATTPTSIGELKTTFEFDLYGTGVDSGQTTFHLRHAYAELGQFAVGQYWSTFMDIDVFPNILEYWGPPGQVNYRNIQFRWMPLKGNNAVIIALERPGASADKGIAADRIELQNVQPQFDMPDLIGNVRLTRGWGHFQAAGIIRRMRWEDTNGDEFDLSGHDVGWGIDLTSLLKFGKNDVAKLGFVYGEGIQNYMNDAPVDVGIERRDNGDLFRPIRGTALPVLGWHAFLDHTWNTKFTSSIGYSLIDIDNSEGQTSNAFRNGKYAVANLLYIPVENAMVGGEFQWGRRENFRDGFAANDYRIQFSFKYNFSKIFSY